MVDDARPFFVVQTAVEAVDAQLPERIRERLFGFEQFRIGDQAFVFKQADQLLQAPCPPEQTSPHQTRATSGKVQGFAFLGRFCFIKSPNTQIDNVGFAKNAPAYRGDADVQPDGICRTHDLLFVIRSA